MKKQPITKFEYILDDDELKLFKKCLDYVFHRLEYHEESGIQGIIKKEEVDKLREELK